MFIAYCFHIYAQIILFFQELKSKYFNKCNYIFFQVLNVYCISNKTDVTQQFISNTIDIVDNDIYCFEWIFDNSRYIQYLQKQSLQHLVPYSIYTLRTKSQDFKIIACILTNNYTKEVSNITKFIKKIAGPFQNFYKGIYEIHSKDIFGLQNKNIQLITSKSSYNFDLSKDNILEL